MRARILALTLVFVLAAHTASAVVVLVLDPALLAKTIILTVLQQKIYDVEDETAAVLRRMGRRLSIFVDLGRYAPQNWPRWRTWRGDTPSAYALAYMSALNAGVSDPEAVAPARPVDPELELPPLVLQDIAVLDYRDSHQVTGTDMSGRARAGRYDERETLAELESAVLDTNGSMSARLDVLSAGAMMRGNQNTTTTGLLGEVVGQLAADTIATRHVQARLLAWRVATLTPKPTLGLAEGMDNAITGSRR
jgi:hypothetical protein